jgi:hypothetical protein
MTIKIRRKFRDHEIDAIIILILSKILQSLIDPLYTLPRLLLFLSFITFSKKTKYSGIKEVPSGQQQYERTFHKAENYSCPCHDQ